MATPQNALVHNATTPGEIMESVIVRGDLAKLQPEERAKYYSTVCQSIGLNPLTKPFEYITLNGKLTLYARKDATDQLRSLRGVSVVIVSRERVEDVYVVTARATTADGRSDESIGAVAIGAAKGEALANALMKAETKAKRRVTLSICGLGMLDETEVETIPAAHLTPANVPPVDGPATDAQVEELAEIVATLLQADVEYGKILAGINRLAPADLQDLEQESFAELTAAGAAKVIAAYRRRLAELAPAS
jgi:hypothetical protein